MIYIKYRRGILKKSNVVVLFGGNSVEKDVSIISAIQVINAINREKYNVISVFITEDHRFLENKNFDKLDTFKGNVKGNEVNFIKSKNGAYLMYNNMLKKKQKIDFVIPVVHGKNVEDGVIAGFLETLKIPYSSCSVLSGAVFQNKHYTKVILDYHKIRNVKHEYIVEEEWIENSNECLERIKKIGFPLIVKAVSLGSSIGIFKVKSEDDLFWALSTAFKYDKGVIVEECLEEYREYNQAIVNNIVSSIEEVKGDKDFLTFKNKYENSNVKKVFPAEISIDLEKRISEITRKIALIFQIKGVIRVDYLYDEKEDILYVNEVNSIPGSLAFYLFNDLSFSKLIDLLINEGIRYQYLDKLKVSHFDSNILSAISGFKVK